MSNRERKSIKGELRHVFSQIVVPASFNGGKDKDRVDFKERLETFKDYDDFGIFTLELINQLSTEADEFDWTKKEELNKFKHRIRKLFYPEEYD